MSSIQSKVCMVSFHKAVDGGFCRLCALFARHRSKLGALVNKPFVIWFALDSVFLKIRTREKYNYEVWRLKYINN